MSFSKATNGQGGRILVLEEIGNMLASTIDKTVVIRDENSSEDLLDRVVQAYPEAHNIEQDATGEVIIMPPTGGESSDQNSEIVYQLRRWSKEKGGGKVFESSVLFILPSGAKRGPDASWISDDKWESLSHSERKKFLRLVPDFVIELRSETDRLQSLQNKMQEYIDNFVPLGWLIDPIRKQVWIYRQENRPQRLERPRIVEAEGQMASFRMNMDAIWDD